MNSERDKIIEQKRFDEKAKFQIDRLQLHSRKYFDISNLPAYLTAPYLSYQDELSKVIGPKGDVLEIGAGTGNFSHLLVGMGANVTLTDYSPKSCSYLKTLFQGSIDVIVVEADMESLPFNNESFDVIACAGVLSYGDHNQTREEIFRVLRKGGYFICVDSLNHNPVYRLNRFIKYLSGKTSRSAIKRIPDSKLIESYRSMGTAEVTYFGAFSWIMPTLNVLFGLGFAVRCSYLLDSMALFNRLAFKFVLKVKKD